MDENYHVHRWNLGNFQAVKLKKVYVEVVLNSREGKLNEGETKREEKVKEGWNYFTLVPLTDPGKLFEGGK